MLKIFDVFTTKSYHFIVKEINMVEIMNMVHSAKSVSYDADIIFVGKCRMEDETNLWFIDTNLTTNQWCALLEECKKNKYTLIIKDDPNRMYFAKTE